MRSREARRSESGSRPPLGRWCRSRCSRAIARKVCAGGVRDAPGPTCRGWILAAASPPATRLYRILLRRVSDRRPVNLVAAVPPRRPPVRRGLLRGGRFLANPGPAHTGSRCRCPAGPSASACRRGTSSAARCRGTGFLGPRTRELRYPLRSNAEDQGRILPRQPEQLELLNKRPRTLRGPALRTGCIGDFTASPLDQFVEAVA